MYAMKNLPSKINKIIKIISNPVIFVTNEFNFLIRCFGGVQYARHDLIINP